MFGKHGVESTDSMAAMDGMDSMGSMDPPAAMNPMGSLDSLDSTGPAGSAESLEPVASPGLAVSGDPARSVGPARTGPASVAGMFACAAGGGRPAGRKRAWILISSLVLHGVALATLAAVEVWQVQAVAEPPIAEVFEVQLPLPVLPAPPEHTRPAADSPRPHAAASQPPEPPAARAPQPPEQLDPRSIDRDVPPPATDPRTADAPPDTTRDADAKRSGPRTGNGNDTGDAPWGNSTGNDRPLPIGGAITRPRIVPGTKVEPRYTELARQAHLQGVVLLQATIDERGNVMDIVVKKSLKLGLDEEAVRAVSQWKFTPALLNGRPVKVYFDLTVQFEVR